MFITISQKFRITVDYSSTAVSPAASKTAKAIVLRVILIGKLFVQIFDILIGELFVQIFDIFFAQLIFNLPYFPVFFSKYWNVNELDIFGPPGEFHE